MPDIVVFSCLFFLLLWLLLPLFYQLCMYLGSTDTYLIQSIIQPYELSMLALAHHLLEGTRSKQLFGGSGKLLYWNHLLFSSTGQNPLTQMHMVRYLYMFCSVVNDHCSNKKNWHYWTATFFALRFSLVIVYIGMVNNF